MIINLEIFKNKWVILAVVLATVLFVLVAVYWLYWFYVGCDLGRQVNQVSQTAASASKKYKYFSQLDGHGVETEADQWPRVVGVMVDNHPDARPQFGLNQAKIVYEVPVEGSYTRFLAIFDQQQIVTQVGPVRSARPYFLDWLQEYDGQAIYMHSGGSSEAIGLLKNAVFFNADEFAYGNYYWRDNNFYAPHNLFTSSSHWQDLSASVVKNSPAGQWTGWPFGEPSSTSSQPIKSVIIPFAWDYAVVWQYDQDKKVYLRYLDNAKQIDGDGQQLLAKNVLIQFVAAWILDEQGRRKIATTGSGQARILSAGRMIRGKWVKNSLSDRTKFYDTNNQPVNLRAGNTWVEIVPSEVGIRVEN